MPTMPVPPGFEDRSRALIDPFSHTDETQFQELRLWWQNEPDTAERPGDESLQHYWPTIRNLTPEWIVSKAREYLDYIIELPIITEKVFGTGARMKEARARTPSMMGLAAWLGLCTETFYDVKAMNNGVGRALRWAYQMVALRKVEMANAGQANAGLVQRMLGITEKTETTTTDLTPVVAENPVDSRLISNLIHPADPDPLGPNRPLYSAAQLEQGMPFFEPTTIHDDKT